jgi:hypothetical protein
MGILDFIPIIGRVLDRVLPDKAASEAAKLKVMELAQAGELAQLNADVQLAQGQLDINKTEAASPNIFVSGWRPFIGWTCGAALAVQFVVAPILEWSAGLFGYVVKFPILDTSLLTTLVFALLGLGGMRTAEKIKGVASK